MKLPPLLLTAGLALAASASAQSFGADRDNTIYEAPSGAGQSNGLHPGLFAGNTSAGDARRALIRFDLSSIPAGATITSVELRLWVTSHPLGVIELHPVAVHRVTSDWGEGTSNSGGAGGIGAAATSGDATWDNAIEPSTAWGTPGGDFVAAASDTQNVGVTSTRATWSGAGLIADVQGWVDQSFANHGWILIGEEVVTRTARRFGSREHPLTTRQPVLVVGYAPPSSVSFCDASDGSLASCPCANPGAPDAGCDTAASTGGVRLEVVLQQTAPANRATLRGVGFPPDESPSSIAIRAASLDAQAPVVFGDGLRCVGVPVVRMSATIANGGTAVHIFGHGPSEPLGTQYYQLWFASSPKSFCSADAFHMSGGRTLDW